MNLRIYLVISITYITSNNQRLESVGEEDAFCFWVNKKAY